jgi:hypothetical protein
MLLTCIVNKKYLICDTNQQNKQWQKSSATRRSQITNQTIKFMFAKIIIVKYPTKRGDFKNANAIIFTQDIFRTTVPQSFDVQQANDKKQEIDTQTKKKFF